MTKRMLFALIGLIACASAIHFQHEGGYYWSTVTEKPGGVCTSITECDGVRTCEAGRCSGIARPPKNEDYYYSQLQTQSGCPARPTDNKWPNKDYYCDGLRKCVNGKCTGLSRPQNLPTYFIYESGDGTCPTPQKYGYVKRDSFCDGQRTCFYGKCKGVARPPKSADYHYDEKLNTDGYCLTTATNTPIKDYFCDGLRTCSSKNRCEGTAR